MFSGANPRQGLDLDMLHKDDHAPIRYARICRKDGEEVPWDDIVKGYEYSEGDYVVLTKKDFTNANAQRTQTVDIQQFVEAGEIDIRYFEKPYYLEPVKGGEKAYALLRESLEAANKLALAKYVVHEREHLGAIKPVGKALVLTQMRFPAELREATALNFPDASLITAKEREIAIKLINQETKHFIAEDFHDTYTEELQEVIAEKTKGKKPSKHGTPPKDTNAKDLMATLKASIKEVGTK